MENLDSGNVGWEAVSIPVLPGCAFVTCALRTNHRVTGILVPTEA